jgi:predicted nucleic acid-binding protein
MEIINALATNKRRGVLTQAEASDKIQLLHDLDLDFIEESPEILDSAAEYSLREEVSVYDALYVALAKNLGAVLFSCDRKQLDWAEKYVSVQLVS